MLCPMLLCPSFLTTCGLDQGIQKGDQNDTDPLYAFQEEHFIADITPFYTFNPSHRDGAHST